MVNIRSLDPSASPLDYYGSELRRLREEAGLSQTQLGKIVFCTGSLVGQIETAHKVPTREFSERIDAALMTGGLFTRLVGLVLRSQLPSWFQEFAEMEAQAAYISTYQSQMVYGLLQTEAYARAVLSVEQTDRLEELLAARMERQRILRREHPPVLCVVLDEAMLHREIGGPEVMRAQLEHLLSFAHEPWVQIQVLPNEVGEHPGLLGSFTLLRFDKDPDLFYCESYDSGHMTANSCVIRERSVGYARLQAMAASPKGSAELIARVMEERYGPGAVA
ncbi:helix-turn-helix domain-containing protein [Streptomyces sp. R302]|uniref:Scr1 family TA system antitoxin-like transcriptional regulator n=1 Tax=unclassified Streptomyces TaxID=2593676 RepID=UPI00145EABFB|nr:helix-turn-helix domain-containing protein [Streptomyces sp. R301]NML79111.1 helix-turn-helix domain-containing protein [Streptomyces sp. R302]